MNQDLGEMIRSQELRQYADSAWQSKLVRPVLIAILATSLMAGPLALAMAIVPNPNLDTALIFCFAAALFGVYVARWLVLPSQRQTNKILFRAAEVVVVLVVVRLGTWAVGGQWPTWEAVRGWILHPQTFFDSAFVVTGLLAFLAWDRGANVSAIFEQLALGPDEIAWILQQRQGGSWREARPAERIRTSRQALYERYMTQWITGGAFLVFFAGISRVQVTGGQSWLRLTELGLPPQVVPAIVAYFLIGLVLASMARFAMLRAQWLFDGVETAPALPVRWQRISLLLILAIGLAAILLPLGSTWQAGRILGMILGFLIQVVMAIYLLILWLVTSVMALLLPTGEAPPPPPDLLQPSPVQPPPAPPVSTLPPWLGGAGFWLITIILSLFAVAYVFGRLGIRPDRESLRRLRSLLWERLRAWWESLRGLARDVQRLIPSLKVGTDQEAEAGRRPWRFIRLGALPPREKIRYFYLSTVRRAGERGVTRRPSQTPHEFVRDLESAWPEVELDVESLTEAFVAARYDAMPISEPEAKDVQTVWQRIKKALRRRWNRSDQDAGV